MKRNNLKSLLAGYRVTLADPTSDIALSVVSTKAILDDAIAELGAHSATRQDAHRVSKILDAVVADMRAEDEAAAKSAQKAAEVSGPPAP